MDVDHFLKWLAVNTAMVNWDSYGTHAKNFYMFNHPTRKLVWIPWDLNMSMLSNPGVVEPTGPEGGGVKWSGLSLSLSEVTPAFPLIRYVIDDPVYAARYKAHMKTFITNIFTESAMDALFNKYHALVSPHIVGANGEQPGYRLYTPEAFLAALEPLKAHVRNRRALVVPYVQ